jgi:hypothetical protein
VRVLTAKASYAEAGKVLRLYGEMFDTARRTDSAQVARDLRRFHAEQDGNAKDDVHNEKFGTDEEFDIDTDRDYIKTLTFGTRLLCKYLDNPTEGLKLAKRAREIFDEGRDTTLAGDKIIEGVIERALGIAFGAFTAKGSFSLANSCVLSMY